MLTFLLRLALYCINGCLCLRAHKFRQLNDVVQFVSGVGVLCVIGYPGVGRYQSVLCANVQGVVDFPVDVTDLPGGMEQTLNKDIER